MFLTFNKLSLVEVLQGGLDVSIIHSHDHLRSLVKADMERAEGPDCFSIDERIQCCRDGVIPGPWGRVAPSLALPLPVSTSSRTK